MKDFMNKNKKELQGLLSEKKIALRNFRFNVAGSNTRNVREGRALRRDAARIETILNAQAKETK